VPGGGLLWPAGTSSESQRPHVRETVARINKSAVMEHLQSQHHVAKDKENPFRRMLQSSEEEWQPDHLPPSQPPRHYSLGWSRTLPPPPSPRFKPVRSASSGGLHGSSVEWSPPPTDSGVGRQTKRSQSLEPELVTGRPPPAYRPHQPVGSSPAGRGSSTEPEMIPRGFASGRPSSMSPAKPNSPSAWRDEDVTTTPRGQGDQRSSGKYVLSDPQMYCLTPRCTS
jgi:hypothetical protein